MMSSPALEALQQFRRALPPGPPAPGEATDAYKDADELAYVLSQLPTGTRRPLKVICVGAGFSGLALAHHVETGQLPGVSLTVYEKNNAVGGTWYENRYPGCACDIPIHNYQFSWAPYPHFPSYYAAQKDIHDYIEKVADQHRLRKYVQVSHKVIGARWIEGRQKWQITIVRADGRDLMTGGAQSHEGETGEPWTEECDVFVNASGCFNDWKWPAIAGRESFRGDMVHSAQWPRDLSLKGKTVALIGNGSTGVQILPAILDDVAKVYVFMRSKTWITAGFAQKYAGPGGSNLFFSEEQKKAWAEDPDAYLAYRKEVEAEINSRFRLYLKHSREQKEALSFSTNQMKQKLAPKPDIFDLLLPDFSVGCRRATPGNGYLEALCSDKVEVIWGEIEAFDETGVKSAGTGSHYAVDSVICATGFNMGFAPRFPIVGQGGVDLQQRWTKETPECYLSVTAADMPNYFMYLGPGSPLGHGSVVTSLERVTEYIAKFLAKLQTQNYSSVVPRPEAPRAYAHHSKAWLERTAWSSRCVSTYKNGKRDGPIIGLHPGSRLHFFELLQHPRWEDFQWKSLCPDPDLAFAWLANGFTVDESTPNSDKDLTWFLPPVSKEEHIHDPQDGEQHKSGAPLTNGSKA